MLRPDHGTALVFAVSGVIQASWMARLPAIQDRLHLGNDDLGVALGALGLGTVLGMAGTGRLSARIGSRRVVLGASGGAAGMLVAVAVAPTAWTLNAALLAFGIAVGAWDAGMNIQGAAVAQDLGGHLMTRFHGFWSVGTVIGAGSAAVAARAGVAVATQCIAVAAMALALAVLGAGADDGTPPPDDARRRDVGLDRKRVRVSRRLIMLAALILVGGFVEGAANDWLAVLLVDRGFTHADAAAGYAVFVAAMTVGRFAAEHLRIGPDRLVRWGALFTGTGVVVTVLAPADPAAHVGAALWGLGVCVVFPVVLAAGGAEPGADRVVGALTTVGYGAGLIGPLLLGLAAERVQLGTSLLSLPLLALAIASLATAVRPTPRK